jgi:glutaredoxin
MKNNTIAYCLLSATLLGFTAAPSAQTVYRIVGPDGKVTFSDKAPVSAQQGKVSDIGVGANVVSSGSSGLPFELRQVVSKFPVTLYTTDPCAPCDGARAMLTTRGVPFSERTVTTPEDSNALRRLTGDTSLPAVSIGGQRLKGFSESEWSQYLDAAGYPKASTLPEGFKNAATMPLVSVQKPAIPAPKAAEKAAAPAPVQTPPDANLNNPAGIQF